MDGRKLALGSLVGLGLLAAFNWTNGCTRLPTVSPASPAPSAAPSPGLTTHTLTIATDPGQVTGFVVGPCHTRDRGSLPDPRCTPGGYDPMLTALRLCSPAYSTQAYRPPESQTHFARYEVIGPAYGAAPGGELDHLVPLELGGSNDMTNLWPEAGRIPNPKDRVENELHAWVCEHPTQARLHAAQAAIASDWLTADALLGAQ